MTVTASVDSVFVEKMQAALVAIKAKISEISHTWQIPSYPLFLRTCSMHKTSVEFMKWKYMKKILLAYNHQQQNKSKDMADHQKEKFVISFTGSSVSAGHDSPFNLTMTPVVQELLTNVFSKLDLDLESRNVALGNNPCVPYDVCVKYFAGLDADVVVWEQTYFCSGSPLESFIREAMTIPTHPIVVFSTSSTSNWGDDKCVSGNHEVNHEEKKLLEADLFTLVSELNRGLFRQHWGDLVPKEKHYHAAGIQAFSHHGHEAYACQGPYIKKWAEGAASWHPSIIAHRLRASHHAYFWLRILELAVDDLHRLASNRALDAIIKDVNHHLAPFHSSSLPLPLNHQNFPDNTTCYTNYEPRAIREASLKGKVLNGLVEEEHQTGWKYIIYEDLVDKGLVKKSHNQGYINYKWLLYSKDNDHPLSLALDISRSGPVFVCQTPGIWGHLPSGFVNLWEKAASFFVTLDTAQEKSFQLDEKVAKPVKVHYEKESMELCVQLMIGDSKDFPVGHHVLSIKPMHSTSGIIVTWLLTP
eukprot:gene2031-2214_t